MLREPNKIIIQKRNDMSDEDFWLQISWQLKILMNQDQVITVRDNDKDTIVIEFNHDEKKEKQGFLNPVWITTEQEELLNQIEFDIS